MALAAFGAMTLPTVVVILAALFGCLSFAALSDVLCVWLRGRHKASLLSLRRQIRKAECANDSRGSRIGVCARLKAVAEINENLGLGEVTAQSHQEGPEQARRAQLIACGHTSYEVETDHLKALVKIPLSLVALSCRSLLRQVEKEKTLHGSALRAPPRLCDAPLLLRHAPSSIAPPLAATADAKMARPRSFRFYLCFDIEGIARCP
jgi:hypothetical protein